jgi:AraC-like DNA-binding protein
MIMFERAYEPIMMSTGSLAGSMSPSTRDLLARLVDVATASAGNGPEAQAMLRKALAMFASGPGPAGLACRGGLAPWQARRVAAYIHGHIGSSLRAAQLATLVRLSNSHFFRAFKVSFHETPAAYIMRQRMRLAQDLMLTTRHPLSQIALQCGLCDQAHFSRMFRRFVGLSPRLWRRQLASDPSSQPHLHSLTH